MPQTNYLPLFRATYPLLAPYQKPGGVTVSTTLPGNAVPNIQSASAESAEPSKAKANSNGKSKK